MTNPRSTKIATILARQILDSRGTPTVEVDVILQDGDLGRASVPSGASTGSHEALELRDGDKEKYNGKGVLQAVKNIHTIIAPQLIGKDASKQAEIDTFLIDLDGTPNKGKLGANAILGVSLAIAKAAASANNQELFQYLNRDAHILPVPMMNVLNGGRHAEDSTDFQEFMLVPWGLPSFSEALRAGAQTYRALKSILKEQGLSTGLGDEGGFAPQLKSNKQAVELLLKAIEKAGFTPGKDIAIALDIAATEFKDGDQYRLATENKVVTVAQLIDLYEDLITNYHVISIEDGLYEDDWEGWTELTKRVGNKAQIVGDDLFVTNTKRLQKGINEKSANAVIIKPNQIGTLTETLAAIDMTKKAGFAAIIANRSGETEDTTIADLAVGKETGQIKTGAPTRSDRVAKYNQLLRIEEMLGDKAVYAGKKAFPIA